MRSPHNGAGRPIAVDDAPRAQAKLDDGCLVFADAVARPHPGARAGDVHDITVTEIGEVTQHGEETVNGGRGVGRQLVVACGQVERHPERRGLHRVRHLVGDESARTPAGRTAGEVEDSRIAAGSCTSRVMTRASSRRRGRPCWRPPGSCSTNLRDLMGERNDAVRAAVVSERALRWAVAEFADRLGDAVRVSGRMPG